MVAHNGPTLSKLKHSISTKEIQVLRGVEAMCELPVPKEETDEERLSCNYDWITFWNGYSTYTFSVSEITQAFADALAAEQEEEE